MQRIIKRYFWIVLVAVGLQKSWGFALLGPQQPDLGAESWQTAVIGYILAYSDSDVPGGPEFLGDIGGPHNIGEEYRRNTPKLYYTYDQTFINFFGPDAMASVDGAFSIMNGLPAADKIDLSLFPVEATHLNYTAQALFLTDIKSVTLHLLVEQMGLADPERFVWTLHDRLLPPGGVCPVDEEYSVVGRNLDYLPTSKTQIQYSPYINDIFYSYFISEICTGPDPLALTIPFTTDPEATPYTSVAANNFDGFGLFSGVFFGNDFLPRNTSGGLQIGYFYSGLTRDDAAGLKYLYSTNKVDYEFPHPSSLLFYVTTNLTLQQTFPSANATNFSGTNGGFYFYDGSFGYGDYGGLVAASMTNSPAVLQALYPGLVIASSTNYFVTATNWTYTQYFTNTVYGQPYPPVLTLVTVSNPQPYLLEKFVTTFANVFSDPAHPIRSTTTTKLQTTTVTPNIGAPYGSPPLTNTTTKTVTLNSPSGDFFLLPLFSTNACPLDILRTGLTNVVATTNILTGTTTNVVTATNTSTYSSTLAQITYFTNYQFVVNPVSCAELTNVADLYQGIGGVKFVRHDFDSLVGQYFSPITNSYTMVQLTNFQWRTERFTRVVTQPDILLDAADMGFPNTVVGTVSRNITYIPSPVVQPITVIGPRGPGTIATPTTITYDKIGEAAWNGYDLNFFLSVTNEFLYQKGEIPSLAWASFDATTNAPEVYPNGTSIGTLEAILGIHFSPVSPPNGRTGTPYSQAFAVGGGLLQAPLNWSAANLPPGLSVSNAANGTDFVLSGTPSSSGVYDFVLYLTDSSGRTVQWNFSITIY